MKRLLVAISIALIVLAGVSQADPGKPNFGPAVYGDGQVWGTKAATTIPAPNGKNLQSFDKLFVLVNGAAGQLAVAEAAPGNRAYNGGRWFTHTAMWTAEGLAQNDPLPVLMSYDEVEMYRDLGHLAISPGSPEGGPPPYFECPLLPVR